LRVLSTAMLAQLATFHSPRDLRLAVLTDAAGLADWDWVKWLPHAQHGELADATGPARLIAASRAELVALLGDELAARRRRRRRAAGRGRPPGRGGRPRRQGRRPGRAALAWPAGAAGRGQRPAPRQRPGRRARPGRP